jgi:hypothetical protein
VSRWIEPSEGFENPRHFVRSDAYSSVIQVDTNAIADVTAAEENASSGFCVFDRVANQVAQDGAEKQRVALYRGGGLGGSNADPFP